MESNHKIHEKDRRQYQLTLADLLRMRELIDKQINQITAHLHGKPANAKKTEKP